VKSSSFRASRRRTPLFTQRWASVPPASANLRFVDGGARLPDGTQTGVRWSHIGAGFEYSLSWFDGFNHLPNIEVHVPFVPGELILTRVYPDIRSYGVDAAVPTPCSPSKARPHFTSPESGTDEFVLTCQLERRGEWQFVGGYAGKSSRSEMPSSRSHRIGTTRCSSGAPAHDRREPTAAIEGRPAERRRRL
jgi:hypothetical protein